MLHRRLVPCALLLTLCGGCASTEISTPYGSYRSTKDVDVGNFQLDVVEPDGTEVHVKVERATGDASAALRAQAEAIAKLLEDRP